MTSCLEPNEPKTPSGEFHDNSDISENFETNSQNIELQNSVLIKFANNQVEIENPFENQGVTISQNNSHITIHSTILNTEVNYILSGITQNGSLKMYSDFKYSLVFNGVSIFNNSGGAAINIQSEKETTINLVGGTHNRLVDSGPYKMSGNEDMKSTIFSEGQLIFEGNGDLLVYGSAGHAVCSDDFIEINSGNITIPRSMKDGIHANDYIEITGGNIEIATENGDGIETEYDYININSANLNVRTSAEGAKCLKSIKDMTLRASEVELFASGNSYYDEEDKDIKSSAGIKCDGNLLVANDCNLQITNTGNGGKGINIVGNFTFNGGNIDVTTSGNLFEYSNDNAEVTGIKCDSNITINNGTLKINTTGTASEGLKADWNFTINGGNIEIEAIDDAINITKNIDINGGTIYCKSENAVGIDADGQINIFDGLIIANGAKKSVNCSENMLKINGGTLFGFGGEVSVPTEESQQNTLIYSIITEDTPFYIENESEEEILLFDLPQGNFDIIFSSSNLKSQTSYNIYKDGTISGGTNYKNYFTGATYTKGTKLTSFTINSVVTKM
jgi:hypothetical protein